VGATALLTEEVRELVRRGMVDPAVEPEAVRSLVAAAVAEYEDRSLTSACRRCWTAGVRRGRCGMRWPASGRCSVTSMTLRWKRSASTSDSPTGR